MGRPRKKKVKLHQVQLEDRNVLPLLKNLMGEVGKCLDVPGTAWGSACPAGDDKKIFKCTIVDIRLMRKFDEGKKEESISDGIQLTEMGVDGTGGNSVNFWMKYPLPFLSHFYKSHPSRLPQGYGAGTGPRADAEGGAAAAAPVAGTDADDDSGAVPDEKHNEKVYTHLQLLRAFKVNDKNSKQHNRICSKFTCTIVRDSNGMSRHGLTCKSPVTVWGKSSGPFFKHCRRFAKKGCAGHIEVLKELNELSVRQVLMPDGNYVTVHSFKESFTHHIGFTWLVAGGMPMRNSRKPLFRSYIRGYEPRALLPSNVSVHRIATCIDEIQLAKQRLRRARHIAEHAGHACIGLQLDLFTDSATHLAYACIHVTYIIETSEELELNDETLDFNLFPTTTHTAVDVRDWLTATLVTYGIDATSIAGVTPDGEAAGRKGIAEVPGLKGKSDVCDQHNNQRTLFYMTGQAGPKAQNVNPDARDLIKVNKRVVQLTHQVREVTYGIRDVQIAAGVPQQKQLSPVTTHAVRWGNIRAQIERNNVMRPIYDNVLAKYRRVHAGDAAIIELEAVDHYCTDEEESQPRGLHFAAATTVTRREIGFTSDAWESNLELEGLMEMPFAIKETLDKKRYVTRGGVYFLIHDFLRGSAPGKPLEIKLHPTDVSVAARSRATAVIAADSLRPLVVKGREQAVTQIQKRWFTNRPSDTLLILILLSKQGKAAKILPAEWLQHAHAVYLTQLRATATRLSIGVRASPRRRATTKRKAVFGASSDEEDKDDTTAHDETPTDPVLQERRIFDSMDKATIASFKDSKGIVNEFKLMHSIRKTCPVHVALFKQSASHLPTEQNAEETFSLAGKLSNDNTHTLPWFMATLVRIAENHGKGCDATDEEIWAAYIDKYRDPDEGDDKEELYVSEEEDDDDDPMEDDEPMSPAPANGV